MNIRLSIDIPMMLRRLFPLKGPKGEEVLFEHSCCTVGRVAYSFRYAGSKMGFTVWSWGIRSLLIIPVDEIPLHLAGPQQSVNDVPAWVRSAILRKRLEGDLT